MYKLVIQTNINLIPIKSPIHTVFNLQSKQTLQQINLQSNERKLNTFILQQLPGRIHLLRNIIPNNNNNNKIINVNVKHNFKLQQKSRALFLINPTKQIVNMLQERLMEIEIMYKILQSYSANIMNNNFNLHVAIIFKSIAIAEQIYSYLQNYKMQESGIFYIDNISVAIVDKLGDVENWKDMLVQEQTGRQIWAEIPHCLKCLEILDPQITGIEPKLQMVNTQSVKKAQPCLVCTIRQKKHSLKCSECSQSQDTWVCMVCGVIGCGRYKNADAYKHYVTSKHILSLDLKSHHIWNYKLDCFSHKISREGILQNYIQQQKDQIDNQTLELQFWKYCNIVSEQLDRQRKFYEKIKQQQIQRLLIEQKALQDKLAQLQKRKEDKKQNLKKKQKKNKKLQKKFIELQEQCKQERQLNKYLQQSVKNRKVQHDNKNQHKNNPVINRKRLQLKEIQEEIEQCLLSLTV